MQLLLLQQVPPTTVTISGFTSAAAPASHYCHDSDNKFEINSLSKSQRDENSRKPYGQTK